MRSGDLSGKVREKPRDEKEDRDSVESEMQQVWIV